MHYPKYIAVMFPKERTIFRINLKFKDLSTTLVEES